MTDETGNLGERGEKSPFDRTRSPHKGRFLPLRRPSSSLTLRSPRADPADHLTKPFFHFLQFQRGKVPHDHRNRIRSRQEFVAVEPKGLSHQSPGPIPGDRRPHAPFEADPQAHIRGLAFGGKDEMKVLPGHPSASCQDLLKLPFLLYGAGVHSSIQIAPRRGSSITPGLISFCPLPFFG